MEKIKLKVCSTSFLNPKNKYWNYLKENYRLNFSEINDWSDLLTKSQEKENIFAIIFMQDLYDNFEDEKEIENFFNLFSKLLKHRLSKSNSRIFLCISKFTFKNLFDSKNLIDNLSYIYFNFLLKIYRIRKNFDNLIFVDIDDNLALEGFINNFDFRNWYAASCRLSYNGMKNLIKVIEDLTLKLKHSPCKVLVLDCDNTLWGGVVAEDGVESINYGEDGIGKIYYDFQKEIRKLKKNGILLALSSKNNEVDVIEAFKKRKMLLKLDDFISIQINWQDKYKSILKISKDLNLSLEDIAFWDDNPLERSQMKKMLREVQTIDVPSELYLWPKFIKKNNLFSKFTISLEDKEKHQQYKIRSSFLKDLDYSKNKTNHLKTIKLNPKKILIDDSNLARAEQLTLKTNQFNLTTKRYSKSEISLLNKDINFNIFLVHLNDIYGDHGIVAMVVLKKVNSEIVLIDSFLMSCRVLGRYLDYWIMHEIYKIAKKKKFKYIIGNYIETKKNILTKDFYKKFNFSKFQYDDLSKYKEFKCKEGKFYIVKINEIKNDFLKIYAKD